MKLLVIPFSLSESSFLLLLRHTSELPIQEGFSLRVQEEINTFISNPGL